MESVERFPPFGDFVGPRRCKLTNVLLCIQPVEQLARLNLFFMGLETEIQKNLLSFQGLLQLMLCIYGFGMVNGGHYIREAICITLMHCYCLLVRD